MVGEPRFSGGLLPALQFRRFLSTPFRSTQHLPVEADAFEPIVQAKQVGESDAAVHFRRQSRNIPPNIAQMRLCLASAQTRLVRQRILCIGRVPHHRSAGRQRCDALGQGVFKALEAADDHLSKAGFGDRGGHV